MTDQHSDGAGRQIDRGAIPGFAVGEVIPWSIASYAGFWFEDALEQVLDPDLPRTDSLYQGWIRRQIVFALCFFESRFFEWVRDVIPSSRSMR